VVFIPRLSDFCYFFHNFSDVIISMEIVEAYMIAKYYPGEQLEFFSLIFPKPSSRNDDIIILTLQELGNTRCRHS